MATRRDHPRFSPFVRHAGGWVSSPPLNVALQLISPQRHLLVADADGCAPRTLSTYTEPDGLLLSGSGLLLDAPEGPFSPFVPGCCPEHDRLRPPPFFQSAHGSVYYSPSRYHEARRQQQQQQRPHSDYFPPPLIEPRQRRPHSIHIISYPSGFVPRELRQPPPGSPERRRQSNHECKKQARKKQKKEEKERSKKQEKRRSLRSLPPGSEKVGRVLSKILAVFAITPKQPSPVSAAPTPRPRPRSCQPRPSSFASFARRFSRNEGVVAIESVLEGDQEVAQTPDMAGPLLHWPYTPAGAFPQNNRNSIISMRSFKTIAGSSVPEAHKPVASGSGISCSILLAEPSVYLTGFDHDHRSRRNGTPASALLRGKLLLNVSKNVKIKSVSLKLVGKARTEWPEGIPPTKTEMFEEQILRSQSLVFFHAMHDGMWDTEYGYRCTYTHRASPTGLLQSLQGNVSQTSLHHLGLGRVPGTLTAKELKRLSLQSVNSRSFGKGESPLTNQVQAKGYKVFRPGTYEYAFELPIDHNQLETANLQYGSVKWELQARIERAGAFKPNLQGSREVLIVRVPDQMSLETTEPISVNRCWDDQLHYDITISGKSFPIGSRIPISFKLTPLAKVQIHKIKIFVTENIEYWTNDRHVTRKDPSRKILLFEKTAGHPIADQYSNCEFRFISGGEPDPKKREEARRRAAARRNKDRERARSSNGKPESLPEVAENLLGPLDLGLEDFWGPTEMEVVVPLPTCEMMERRKELKLHPDCSWKNVNVFHWLKIVLRVSLPDESDSNGRRRKHFEISIDSPFTVLNCRATQANLALPRYSGPDGIPIPEQRPQKSCGCPDAKLLDPSASGAVGALALIEEDILPRRRLRLDTRNIQTRNSVAQNGNRAETITTPPPPPHSAEDDPAPPPLVQVPSYDPPAFDADDPPPPLPNDLLSPPPRYDVIVGTPSVDGLADYFVRLAAYERSRQANGEQGDVSSPKDTATDVLESPAAAIPTSAPLAELERRPEGEDGVEERGLSMPMSAPGGGRLAPILETTTQGQGEETGVRVRESEADAVVPATAPSSSRKDSTTLSETVTTQASASESSTTQTPTARARSLPATVEEDTLSSSDSSAEDDSLDPARPHRMGRVNVANPRTPGGRSVPSRSLDIERPVIRLDLSLSSVLRRRARNN